MLTYRLRGILPLALRLAAPLPAVLGLCAAMLLAAVLCGCGGHGAGLRGLPAPEGVRPDTWQSLTAELEAELARRGVEPGKVISAPPASEASAAQLAYNASNATLSWGYCCQGDYDQNGEVNISDLTPLAQHLGEVSPLGAGEPFPYDTIQAVIDGNRDGELNIADVTPIGVGFGTKVTGYNVYFSASTADYPAANTADNGPGAGLLAWRALSSAISEGRKRFSYTLANPQSGAYYWVRPSDGTSEGTPSEMVQIAVQNQEPQAVIGATPTYGFAPLVVQFNAYASTDMDGEIVKYEWDYDGALNGENWEDTDAQPDVEHTYEEEGDFFPTLRVTDDKGSAATDFLQIRIKQPPVAQLNHSFVPGLVEHLVWDASASSDPDGEVVNYEWDFDGDGTYEHDSGMEATRDFYYYEPGEYTVGVRVTDDDGLVDEASRTVVLNPTASWHVTLADEPYENPDRLPVSKQTAILEIDGNPEIFYCRYLGGQDPGTLRWNGISCLRADDALGESWPDPVIILPSDANWSVAMINCHPALAIPVQDGGLGMDYVYVRADDTAGSSWPEPTVVADETLFPVGTLVHSLFVVDGNPAIFAGGNLESYYLRANDPNGLSWSSAVVPGVLVYNCALAAINALPAMLDYRNYEDLLYHRAEDASGTRWAEPVLIDQLETVGSRARLLAVAGVPAVIYYDDVLGGLKFRRALDAEGTAWGKMVVLDTQADGRQLAAVLDGRPAVIYGDRIDDGIKFISANDAEGSVWGFPSAFASYRTPFSASNKDRAWESFSVGDVNGSPAVAHIDWPEGTNELRFFSYR